MILYKEFEQSIFSKELIMPKDELQNQTPPADQEEVVAEGGCDERGIPYSQYAECPNCPDGGRVGIAASGDDWYCYECCCTF